MALHYELYREHDKDDPDDQWHHSLLYGTLKPLLQVYQHLGRENAESKTVGSILATLFLKAGWEPRQDKDLKRLIRKLASNMALRSFLDQPELAQRTMLEVTKDPSVAYFRKTLLGCVMPAKAIGKVLVPAGENSQCDTSLVTPLGSNSRQGGSQEGPTGPGPQHEATCANGMKHP